MTTTATPHTNRFVNWALSKAKTTTEYFHDETDGITYEVHERVWQGSLGAKATNVHHEIGPGTTQLINHTYHQLHITNKAKYTSQYGNLRIVETIFTPTTTHP